VLLGGPDGLDSPSAHCFGCFETVSDGRACALPGHRSASWGPMVTTQAQERHRGRAHHVVQFIGAPLQFSLDILNFHGVVHAGDHEAVKSKMFEPEFLVPVCWEENQCQFYC
jgi:hypothetical protein